MLNYNWIPKSLWGIESLTTVFYGENLPNFWAHLLESMNIHIDKHISEHYVGQLAIKSTFVIEAVLRVFFSLPRCFCFSSSVKWTKTQSVRFSIRHKSKLKSKHKHTHIWGLKTALSEWHWVRVRLRSCSCVCAYFTS